VHVSQARKEGFALYPFYGFKSDAKSHGWEWNESKLAIVLTWNLFIENYYQ